MIEAGWFDWATRDPGPANRVMGTSTAMTVMVHHSLEGWYSPDGSYKAFNDPNRFPTAWHGTVKLDGRLCQHYDVRVRLSHAGDANILGPGFEAEGFAGNPLTRYQVETFLRMHRDLREYTGRPFLRVPGSKVGLVEHREFALTACPSGRYEPLWAAVEDEMATNEELQGRIERLERIIAGGEQGCIAYDYGRNLAGTVNDRLVTLERHTHPAAEPAPHNHPHEHTTVAYR